MGKKDKQETLVEQRSAFKQALLEAQRHNGDGRAGARPMGGNGQGLRPSEALRETNEKLHALIDAAPSAIFTMDVNGVVQTWNPAAERMFGWNAEEAIGRPLPIVPDNKRAEFRALLKHVLKGNQLTAVEVLRQKRDGSPVEISISAAPLHDSLGAVNGVMAVVEDVTDRKQADQALRESQERFRRLSEATFEGVAIHDGGRIIDVNERIAELFGYRHSELINMTLGDLVAPTDKRRLKCALHAAGENCCEALAKRRDGSTFPIEIHCKDIPHNGLALRVAAVRDLSDHKLAQEALRQSEERYRTLIETSSECICNLDLDGKFLYMSPSGLRFHQMTGEQVAGLHCTELAKREYANLLKQTLHRAKRGETVEFQYESDTPHGTRWFESILTPVRDGGGRIVSLMRLSRDVTDRKQAEEELRRSLAKLGKAMEGTIEAMAATAEMRDPYTAGHQRRVSKLACAIAAEMGLAEQEIEGVRMAAAIHDFGKIYVPAEILSRPGSLSELEFSIVRTHPQVSHDILSRIEFPWPIAKIVAQHHERVDGSGYPAGLSGDEIMLEARILGVADVVESMASHRPYRPALGINKALEEISKNRGVLYDADVVDTCLALFQGKKFRF